MKTTHSISETIPKSIVSATSSVLQPLLYLLVSYGMGFQAFQELLKSTYIKVAAEKFRLRDKAQTDSRISLLTGVHRRDVKRLRTVGDAFEDSVAKRVSLGNQIISLWVTDPRYLDRNGRPKPLPRQAGKKAGVSFEDLVSILSSDIRARVLLDDWLHIGVVHLDSENNVHLNVGAFVPNSGLDEKAYFLATNVRDHLAAAVHNIMGVNHTPYLERSLQYEGLSKESIDELAIMAEELSMASLHAVHMRAIELAKINSDKPGAHYRINFGAYCYYAENDKR